MDVWLFPSNDANPCKRVRVRLFGLRQSSGVITNWMKFISYWLKLRKYNIYCKVTCIRFFDKLQIIIRVNENKFFSKRILQYFKRIITRVKPNP